LGKRFRAKLKTSNEELEKKFVDYKDIDEHKIIKIENLFPNKNIKKLDLEIGCGNGHFLLEKGLNEKDTFFIGNEIKKKIIKNNASKLFEYSLKNLNSINKKNKAEGKPMPTKKSKY